MPFFGFKLKMRYIKKPIKKFKLVSSLFSLVSNVDQFRFLLIFIGSGADLAFTTLPNDLRCHTHIKIICQSKTIKTLILPWDSPFSADKFIPIQCEQCVVVLLIPFRQWKCMCSSGNEIVKRVTRIIRVNETKEE